MSYMKNKPECLQEALSELSKATKELKNALLKSPVGLSIEKLCKSILHRLNFYLNKY